jgi:hypothetical protein
MAMPDGDPHQSHPQGTSTQARLGLTMAGGTSNMGHKVIGRRQDPCTQPPETHDDDSIDDFSSHTSDLGTQPPEPHDNDWSSHASDMGAPTPMGSADDVVAASTAEGWTTDQASMTHDTDDP